MVCLFVVLLLAVDCLLLSVALVVLIRVLVACYVVLCLFVVSLIVVACLQLSVALVRCIITRCWLRALDCCECLLCYCVLLVVCY